ncbi:hypothetical protein SEVIR_6G238533v4 [Setaria viridis]
MIWGIEAIKSKYSPPSLQRLCRSGQPPICRYLRAGSRCRRPCGNFSIPGQPSITNSSREVRPSIPSGNVFSALQLHTESLLSLVRSPRFEGSATKLLLLSIQISSRDAGNLGSRGRIPSSLEQRLMCRARSPSCNLDLLNIVMKAASP